MVAVDFVVPLAVARVSHPPVLGCWPFGSALFCRALASLSTSLAVQENDLAGGYPTLPPYSPPLPRPSPLPPPPPLSPHERNRKRSTHIIKRNPRQQFVIAFNCHTATLASGGLSILVPFLGGDDDIAALLLALAIVERDTSAELVILSFLEPKNTPSTAAGTGAAGAGACGRGGNGSGNGAGTEVSRRQIRALFSICAGVLVHVMIDPGMRICTPLFFLHELGLESGPQGKSSTQTPDCSTPRRET